jgi:acyl carrier protein
LFGRLRHRTNGVVMSDLTDRLRSVLCACLGLDDVDLRATVASLGFDSLDLLDLRFRLGHEFGRDVPAAWLRPGRTGLDILAYLRGRSALAAAASIP